MGLSDEQISAMKEAFNLFDADSDGKIAASELGILMRSLGGNPTQAQLKSVIAEEKLTAPFDFQRFIKLMSKHLKPEPFDKQLRDAFQVLDKEGTGFVVVKELRHILTSIGEKLEPADFDEWIHMLPIMASIRKYYQRKNDYTNNVPENEQELPENEVEVPDTLDNEAANNEGSF